jgi:hypothetical protein
LRDILLFLGYVSGRNLGFEMKKATITLNYVVLGISIFCASYVYAQAPQLGDASEFRGVMNRYCVSCHNEILQTASLALDKANIEDISEDPAVWEKVLLKLKTRSMPPVGMPRPDEQAYITFAAHLQLQLDALSATNPDPGNKIATHRLSRLEYSNVVRDLLGIEIDGAALLPPDNSGELMASGSNFLLLVARMSAWQWVEAG